MERENYRHTFDMVEISGYGGKTEETCQDMLDAAVKWIYANTGEEIGYSDLHRLEAYLRGTVNVEVNKTMIVSIVTRALFIVMRGWDEYHDSAHERHYPHPLAS